MLKKVTVGTLVGVLVLGMLMVPAAADHVDYPDVGQLTALGVSGSGWTGCADDGTSHVSGSSGGADPDRAELPNHWTHFEMGNSGPQNDAVSLMDGAIGDMRLCARLDIVSPGGGNPLGNPGEGCVISDGKGSITYSQSSGRETLWLRNVRSHGDVMGAVQPLIGEVVAAPDAATAATMTAHHYIYIELETLHEVSSVCTGPWARHINSTYRIVDQNQSELPLLCEDDWDNGCLYGPGPSELPPL